MVRFVRGMLSYRPRLYLANLLTWAWSAVAPLLPGYLIKVYYDGLTGDAPLVITPWLALVLLTSVGITRAVTNFAGSWLWGDLSTRAEGLVRSNLVRLIAAKPGALAAARSSSETVSRVRDDAEGSCLVVEEMVDGPGVVAFAVAAIVIMGTVDWLITAIVVAPILLSSLAAELVRARVMALRGRRARGRGGRGRVRRRGVQLVRHVQVVGKPRGRGAPPAATERDAAPDRGARKGVGSGPGGDRRQHGSGVHGGVAGVPCLLGARRRLHGGRVRTVRNLPGAGGQLCQLDEQHAGQRAALQGVGWPAAGGRTGGQQRRRSGSPPAGRSVAAGNVARRRTAIRFGRTNRGRAPPRAASNASAPFRRGSRRAVAAAGVVRCRLPPPGWRSGHKRHGPYPWSAARSPWSPVGWAPARPRC